MASAGSLGSSAARTNKISLVKSNFDVNIRRLVTAIGFYSPLWLGISSGILGARLLVTFDSYLYFSSAKSIFTSEFDDHYHWIREPLYPLFLKVVLFFAHSGLLLSLVQSVLLAAGMMHLARTLRLGSSLRFIAALLVFGSAVMVGFNGAVLQQSVMATLLLFGTSTFIRLLRVAKTGTLAEFNRALTAFVIVQLMSVLTTFFFVVPAGVASVVVLWVRTRRLRRLRSALANGAALALPFVGLLSWWVFKYSQIGFSKAPATLAAWPWQFDPTEIPIVSPLAKFLGLTGLGPDTHTQAVSNESLIFAVNSVSQLCGKTYSGPSGFDTYVEGLIVDSCRNTSAVTFYAKTAGFSLQLMAWVVVIGLIVGLITLFMPRFGLNRIGYVVPVAFFAGYLAFALGISRYSVPLYPVLLLMLMATLVSLKSAFKQSQLGSKNNFNSTGLSAEGSGN